MAFFSGAAFTNPAANRQDEALLGTARAGECRSWTLPNRIVSETRPIRLAR